MASMLKKSCLEGGIDGGYRAESSGRTKQERRVCNFWSARTAQRRVDWEISFLSFFGTFVDNVMGGGNVSATIASRGGGEE